MRLLSKRVDTLENISLERFLKWAKSMPSEYNFLVNDGHLYIERVIGEQD